MFQHQSHPLQVQTRKKDERFSHLDFAISPSFIFKGQKTEKMTMTYSRFRFRSDRQFLNLKARIRKIQTLQFLHLFSKGKKTITHSRFRFRSDFSFIFPHASTRRHRLRLLLLLKVRKSQKIYFLSSIPPKNQRKSVPISALASRMWSNEKNIKHIIL